MTPTPTWILIWGLACGSPPTPEPPTPPPSPSPAAVREAPAASVDLDDPTSCAPCHGTVVEEWNESMHARSHHDNDPIYGAMKALRMAKQGDAIGAKCQRCHTPRAPSAPDSPAGRMGVSCATCHAATEVHRDRGPGAAALVFDDGVLRSARDLPAGASPVHGTGPAAPHLADGQTMCLACHDATETPAGAAACTTGPEHRSLDDSATCTSCHMPRVDGPSGVVSTRGHHRAHTFAGPHRAWYQDDPSFLASAVDLSVSRQGPKVVATLVNRADHAVPTGFPGRMMVVMARGLDAEGATVWSNISGDPMADDSDAVLNKVYVDAEGNPVPAPFADALARDHRLRPGETRTLSWSVPPDVARVQVELVMRLLPPKLADTLGIDGVEAQPRVVVRAEG